MIDINTTLAERGTRYGDFPGHAKITQGLKRTMQASPKWGSLTDQQREARGLLEKRTRPSSSGTAKSFWSITEKGLAFGKNISSPENPRETQPHWFSAKGEELLRVMGVLE